MTVLHTVGAAIVAALLGLGAGYLIRGDCAKEVRATEEIATAKAEVVAHETVFNVRLADVRLNLQFDTIFSEIAALPDDPPPPPGCPARALSDAELRLWNASNEGRHVPLQQGGADEDGPDGAPLGGPEREGSGS